MIDKKYKKKTIIITAIVIYILIFFAGYYSGYSKTEIEKIRTEGLNQCKIDGATVKGCEIVLQDVHKQLLNCERMWTVWEGRATTLKEKIEHILENIKLEEN